MHPCGDVLHPTLARFLRNDMLFLFANDFFVGVEVEPDNYMHRINSLQNR